MSEPELPKTKQPDAAPVNTAIWHPSIWMYVGLLAIAAAMVSFAFKDDSDWPSLLLNLATELFGAVVILILVDRRLREKEVNSIRDISKRSGVFFSIMLSWRKRQYYNYCKSILNPLSNKLDTTIRREKFSNLVEKLEVGFVLLGNAGMGKTVWLQQVALDLAKEYVTSPSTRKLPILFPLRNWQPKDGLEKAILEHINRFSPISERSYELGMKSGDFIVMLDGADEIFMGETRSLSSELGSLKEKYPKTPFTISSRPDIPSAAPDLETVNLTPPTKEEIYEIQKRLGLQQNA